MSSQECVGQPWQSQPQARAQPNPNQRSSALFTGQDVPRRTFPRTSQSPPLESLCVAVHGNRITVVASTIPRKLVRRRRGRNFDYALEKWRRVCSAGKQPDPCFPPPRFFHLKNAFNSVWERWSSPPFVDITMLRRGMIRTLVRILKN